MQFNCTILDCRYDAFHRESKSWKSAVNTSVVCIHRSHWRELNSCPTTTSNLLSRPPTLSPDSASYTAEVVSGLPTPNYSVVHASRSLLRHSGRRTSTPWARKIRPDGFRQGFFPTSLPSSRTHAPASQAFLIEASIRKKFSRTSTTILTSCGLAARNQLINSTLTPWSHGRKHDNPSYGPTYNTCFRVGSLAGLRMQVRWIQL